ncbi:uncharacterized protein A1O5_03140 [Cladophialophora psammophila CBS 110553]|uniref:Uncharacterized protein n=1 Tax=Cladophialophora psammophila CBS 110553 TaxID=1182543 RepID=W9X7V1_9EURO|nr:uncharacterized protein A1O5_03140 [Cladophialophora psammophila CBS 110553]EXJ73380.1 hypothetical protein A1O5_03140 [Cladophialophora psammophila CBS 110553]
MVAGKKTPESGEDAAKAEIEGNTSSTENVPYKDGVGESSEKDPGIGDGKENPSSLGAYSLEDIVLVTVGEKKVQYRIHKKIIISNVRFSTNALVSARKNRRRMQFPSLAMTRRLLRSSLNGSTPVA